MNKNANMIWIAYNSFKHSQYIKMIGIAAVSKLVIKDESSLYLEPQSRQSAKLFLQRRNWNSPTPLGAGGCAPHPLVRGGGHTRLRQRGWGSPNSDEGTYTVVLCICKYFVFRTLN